MKKLYQALRVNLTTTIKIFGLAAQEYITQLVTALVIGRENWLLDIIRLNENMPQLQIEHRHHQLMVFGFGTSGQIYAEDKNSGESYELEINGDLTIETINDAVAFLEMTRAEIARGTVEQLVNAEEKTIFLQYTKK